MFKIYCITVLISTLIMIINGVGYTKYKIKWLSPITNGYQDLTYGNVWIIILGSPLMAFIIVLEVVFTMIYNLVDKVMKSIDKTFLSKKIFK